jgi:hypothetical protein
MRDPVHSPIHLTRLIHVAPRPDRQALLRELVRSLARQAARDAWAASTALAEELPELVPVEERTR